MKTGNYAMSPVGDNDEDGKNELFEEPSLDHEKLLGTLESTEVLEKIKKLVNTAHVYFDQNNLDYIYQTEFVMLNKQWTDLEEAKRTNNSKPTLSFNLLYPQVNEILGEYAENTPGLVIRSKKKDDPMTDQKVEIYDGLVRQICEDNRLDMGAIATLRNTLVGGFSIIEVGREYESPLSFDQKITLTFGEDPTSYFFDPAATQMDKGDGRFCGRIYSLDKEDYHRLYGEEASENSFPTSFNEYAQNSVIGNRINVCKIFLKHFYKATIVKLSNGKVVLKDKSKKIIKEENDKLVMEYRAGRVRELRPITIVDERDTMAYRICEYHCVYDEILKIEYWPIDKLPFIFVDGDSSRYQGYQYTKSFCKFAVAQQRLLNYVRSETAAYLLSSQRGQWAGEPGCFSRFDEWTDPGRVTTHLRMNRDSKGQYPTFVPSNPFPQSMIELDASLSEGMRGVLGRYPANSGAPTKEISNVAIQTKIKQANHAANVYVNNVSQNAIQSMGKIIIELIKHTHDTTRDVVIRDKEGDTKMLTINSPSMGGYLNEITDEELDINIESGGNWQVQKDAETKIMMGIGAMYPPSAPVVTYLAAKNSDVPNKNEFIDLIKLTLPPNLQSAINKTPMPPQPPTPEENLQQQKLNNEMATLEIKKQAMITDLRVAEIKAGAEIGNAQIKLEEAITRRSESHRDRLMEENSKLKGMLGQLLS